MAEEKKSFFASKAFFLIIGWLVLGIVLTVVVYKVSPSLEHQCEAWAVEIASGAHGGHGDHGTPDDAHGDAHDGAKHDPCHTVQEAGLGFKSNLAASYHAIMGNKLGTAWSLPNFLILLTILFHFAKTPTNDYMKNRREELDNAINAAEKAKIEAEALQKEYEEKISSLDQEIDDLKAEWKKDGELEKQRLIEAAEKMAEKIQTDADFTAKQEVLMAKYKLREEAAKLAVEVAEKVIRGAISDDDRDKLLDEYLNKVTEQRQ
jgi:F-type H+-transporting ATPase subunit b